MKILLGTNLEHPYYGLKRFKIKEYSSLTSVIQNIRRLFHDLGYNSSLLTDNEILAFQDLVFNYETGFSMALIDALDFMAGE